VSCHWPSISLFSIRQLRHVPNALKVEHFATLDLLCC
jgi:hypothetical protein